MKTYFIKQSSIVSTFYLFYLFFYPNNQDGLCITEEAASKIFTISSTRFITYTGLLVATAIIFQRSVPLAGGLGLVVVSYISVSEYFLSGSTGELRPII